MPMTAPDWLTRHQGSLRPTPDGLSWAVLLNNQPQYRLSPRPAAGRYSCEVLQTVNDKHLGSNALYASAEEALRGGLEDLRKVLGW
jgi:hypothetical protein